MLTSGKFVALGIFAVVVGAGCEKKVASGRYCSTQTPSHCFQVDVEAHEIELLIDQKAVWKGTGSVLHHVLDFYPKGEDAGIYADKPCKLLFDVDDPSKGEIELYERFPNETFVKK